MQASGARVTSIAVKSTAWLALAIVPACAQAGGSGRPADAAVSGQADGMVAIAAGAFMMGAPDGVGATQEHPRHRATVGPFALDRTLVTVGAYDACVRAGACTAAGTEQRGTPGAGPEEDAFCNGARADKRDHPINCVDWPQAAAYCAWAGKRLPTEAEWEYAAKGSDDRTYPWGSDAPSAQACWKRLSGDYAHALGTCPVGAYPAGDSAFGIHDIVGNVWEWTATSWSVDYLAAADPTARVVRGGGWRDSDPSELRCANRNGSTTTDRVINLGFRCAR
jgi:formylglycine-generating enzyme required for sulfatase activity